MIEITVNYHQRGYITTCAIEGHAGYDEHGYDIVCAAVSGIVCTAVLGLQQVAKAPGKYENTSGYCIIQPEYPEGNAVQTILETMILGLAEIARQYSSFVKLTQNGR